MMKLLDKFTESHQDALDRISSYLEPTARAVQFNKLVKWMITTDANPYFYLPEAIADPLNSAQEFAKLLDTISHALYDDGSVEFVAVNGQPRIVFANRFDVNFNEQVRVQFVCDQSQQSTVDIRVLDILPNEFGEVFNKWYAEDLKKRFCWDARTRGVEGAIAHYSLYQLFDNNWVDDCL